MKLKLQRDINLAKLTTFKIGGTAKYFVEATKPTDLFEIFAWLSETKLPYFILSGGSNTVFDDGVFEGLIIKINLRGYEIIKEDESSVQIQISAGEDWDEVFEDGVFIHKNSNSQEPRFVKGLGYSFDPFGDILDLSYVVDGMMFIRRFDAKTFGVADKSRQDRLNPDDDGTRPVFLVGVLPEEVQRAITSQDTNILFPYGEDSLKVFDESMAISEVSAKGFVGSSGIVRMFYQDSNSEIRGISFDDNRAILDTKLRASKV